MESRSSDDSQHSSGTRLGPSHVFRWSAKAGSTISWIPLCSHDRLEDAGYHHAPHIPLPPAGPPPSSRSPSLAPLHTPCSPTPPSTPSPPHQHSLYHGTPSAHVLPLIRRSTIHASYHLHLHHSKHHVPIPSPRLPYASPLHPARRRVPALAAQTQAASRVPGAQEDCCGPQGACEEGGEEEAVLESLRLGLDLVERYV